MYVYIYIYICIYIFIFTYMMDHDPQEERAAQLHSVVCRNDPFHVDEPCPYSQLLARRAAMPHQVPLYIYIYIYIHIYIYIFIYMYIDIFK